MRYTIDGIRNELKEMGWEVLSESYKNLDTLMEFRCPEGHNVTMSYGQWRKTCQCPTCKQNPLKDIEIKIVPKSKGVQRIIAFDQSTTISGWAILDDGILIKSGTYTTHSATAVERIDEVRQWMLSMITMWNVDLVSLEDIFYHEKSDTFKDENGINILTYRTLAELLGVLKNTLFNLKCKYEVIHPATWREYCKVTGKYRADKKRSAQLKIKEWFDITVSTDEADAICIGKYAAALQKKNNTMLSW